MMLELFALRTADPADAAALGALHWTCWQESYAGIVPAGVLASASVASRAASSIGR